MSKEVRTGGSTLQQQLAGLEWHLLQWKRLPAGSQSKPNPACCCKGAHEHRAGIHTSSQLVNGTRSLDQQLKSPHLAPNRQRRFHH